MIFILTLLLSIFLNPQPALAIGSIEVTDIDPGINTNYGTFQSHNQKVVYNQYGIFMTNLHSRNDAYDQNNWRLSRSTDGGNTFSTIYQSTNGTSTPAIDTDSSGNIYVAFPDWGIGSTSTNAYIYKFSPSNNFSQPTTLATIPNSADCKFTMLLDEPRQQIYYFSTCYQGTFSIIGLDGQIKQNRQLLEKGTSAMPHYPHLTLDEGGTLVAGWTNQYLNQYLYWDIHVMKSSDGGSNWQKLDGTPLNIPLVSDETGPTDRITLDGEFSSHTWLSNMIAHNGTLHLMYVTETTPFWWQHYLRYDLASGRQEKNIYPTWKGDNLSILTFDGFFTTKKNDPNAPLYVTGKSTDNHLSVLVSKDNGETWHDLATSTFNNQNPYAIGGARYLSDDGYLLGSYTDQGTINTVRFFRAKINANSSKPGDLNEDGQVNTSDFQKLKSEFGHPYTIFDYNTLVTYFDK